MTAKVISLSRGGTNRPNKVTHSTVDIIIVTPSIVNSWKEPPFQRLKRINAKVRSLAERIRDDKGIIPGRMTLGIVNNLTYLVDGQHRREAFLLSECTEGAAEIGIHYFDNIYDLGRLFVELNSQLVPLRPDDILRALEGTNQALKKIHDKCPFIGYDSIRRTEKSPMLSMSSALRAWFCSAPEVPGGRGMSAIDMAESINPEDVDRLIDGLTICHQSWGRDQQYQRLWNGLNLTITLWLYRRTVIAQYSPATTRLDRASFGRCLCSLSATGGYLDWLHGRNMGNRDRAPCFNRMKIIFAKRIAEDSNKKPRLPGPAWAHG